jgi:hypothetical protein
MSIRFWACPNASQWVGRFIVSFGFLCDSVRQMADLDLIIRVLIQNKMSSLSKFGRLSIGFVEMPALRQAQGPSNNYPKGCHCAPSGEQPKSFMVT